MENIAKKSVYQIVGNSICVEADDGKKVSDVVVEFLKNNQKLELSFLNVTMLTSAFLNSAIGILYKDFSEEAVKSYLSVKDLDSTDALLLKRVVDTAKLYYAAPERMEQSVQAILEEK